MIRVRRRSAARLGDLPPSRVGNDRGLATVFERLGVGGSAFKRALLESLKDGREAEQSERRATRLMAKKFQKQTFASGRLASIRAQKSLTVKMNQVAW